MRPRKTPKMIVEHWTWDRQYISPDTGQTRNPTVYSGENWRISALLDQHGEPLKVAYERPKLGFDLRPRCPENKEPDDE